MTQPVRDRARARTQLGWGLGMSLRRKPLWTRFHLSYCRTGVCGHRPRDRVCAPLHVRTLTPPTRMHTLPTDTHARTPSARVPQIWVAAPSSQGAILSPRRPCC